MQFEVGRAVDTGRTALVQVCPRKHTTMQNSLTQLNRRSFLTATAATVIATKTVTARRVHSGPTIEKIELFHVIIAYVKIMGNRFGLGC